MLWIWGLLHGLHFAYRQRQHVIVLILIAGASVDMIDLLDGKRGLHAACAMLTSRVLSVDWSLGGCKVVLRHLGFMYSTIEGLMGRLMLYNVYLTRSYTRSGWKWIKYLLGSLFLIHDIRTGFRSNACLRTPLILGRVLNAGVWTLSVGALANLFALLLCSRVLVCFDDLLGAHLPIWDIALTRCVESLLNGALDGSLVDNVWHTTATIDINGWRFLLMTLNICNWRCCCRVEAARCFLAQSTGHVLVKIGASSNGLVICRALEPRVFTTNEFGR